MAFISAQIFVRKYRRSIFVFRNFWKLSNQICLESATNGWLKLLHKWCSETKLNSFVLCLEDARSTCKKKFKNVKISSEDLWISTHRVINPCKNRGHFLQRCVISSLRSKIPWLLLWVYLQIVLGFDKCFIMSMIVLEKPAISYSELSLFQIEMELGCRRLWVQAGQNPGGTLRLLRFC